MNKSKSAPVTQVRGTSMAVIEAYASAVAGDQSTGLVPADVLASRKAAAQAVADLADSSATAPGLTPAQQRADELLWALKGAANYIDKLGGVSQSYRVLVNSVEATGQEGGK